MSITRFERIFQVAPDLSQCAHGRVNLIGEHTDYNGGFVLPTLLPQKTEVWIRRRSDDLVRVTSLNRPENFLPTYHLGEESPQHDWVDFIKGVTWIAQKEKLPLQGFDCLIDSSVPMGSGVSSSAALEISLLKGLNRLLNWRHSEVELAKLGQRVENEFVGAHVGIMDQMVCALGSFGEALFIDTRTLSYEKITLPKDQLHLLVINSGQTHDHSQGGYNERRKSCEEAAQALGIMQLRDFRPEMINQLESLPQAIQKRARHVISENQRVLEAVQALENKELERLGDLFVQSHVSMRDDFEVSTPEIDFLVQTLCNQNGVYGARLTGGGFGGSVVAIGEPSQIESAAMKTCVQYQKQTGLKPTVLVPQFQFEIDSLVVKEGPRP